MNFPETLIRILTPEIPVKDQERKHKVFLYVLISYLAMSVLLFAGIRFLFENNYLVGYVLLGAFSLILANRILFSPVKNYEVTSVILCILLGITLLFNFYAHDIMPNAWLYLFLYPVFVMMLLGLKKGLIFSFILPILFLPGIIFNTNFPLVNSNTHYISSIYAGYLALILLIYIYTFIRQKETTEFKQQIWKALQEAQEKNEFISMLSHQLRTSLNNILLVNNLVNSSSLDNAQKDLIDTLQASTNNLVDAVNKIVDVSQTDMIQLKESSISFELESTMESIIKLFRNHDNTDIEYYVSESIVNYIVGDPIKLKQIFLNLLQNIIQQAGDNRLRLFINCLPTAYRKE